MFNVFIYYFVSVHLGGGLTGVLMAPIFVVNGLSIDGEHVGGIIFGGHSLAFQVSGKGEFTQYPLFVRFRPFFLRFCFSLTKYALFHPHFYVSISALTRQ